MDVFICSVCNREMAILTVCVWVTAKPERQTISISPPHATNSLTRARSQQPVRRKTI